MPKIKLNHPPQPPKNVLIAKTFLNPIRSNISTLHSTSLIFYWEIHFTLFVKQINTNEKSFERTKSRIQLKTNNSFKFLIEKSNAKKKKVVKHSISTNFQTS